LEEEDFKPHPGKIKRQSGENYRHHHNEAHVAALCFTRQPSDPGAHGDSKQTRLRHAEKLQPAPIEIDVAVDRRRDKRQHQPAQWKQPRARANSSGFDVLQCAIIHSPRIDSRGF
jgi:hypothetical protein